MALTDQQQIEMYNGIANLYAAMFSGGPSMEDAGRPVQRSLDLMHRGVREILARLDPIYRPDATGAITATSVRQELADVKTLLLGLDVGEVDVDEAALAASLATSLAPLLSEHLDSLSDADVDRLVKAGADEMDRRARLRLEADTTLAEPSA